MSKRLTRAALRAGDNDDEERTISDVEEEEQEHKHGDTPASVEAQLNARFAALAAIDDKKARSNKASKAAAKAAKAKAQARAKPNKKRKADRDASDDEEEEEEEYKHEEEQDEDDADATSVMDEDDADLLAAAAPPKKQKKGKKATVSSARSAASASASVNQLPASTGMHPDMQPGNKEVLDMLTADSVQLTLLKRRKRNKHGELPLQPPENIKDLEATIRKRTLAPDRVGSSSYNVWLRDERWWIELTAQRCLNTGEKFDWLHFIDVCNHRRTTDLGGDFPPPDVRKMGSAPITAVATATASHGSITEYGGGGGGSSAAAMEEEAPARKTAVKKQRTQAPSSSTATASLVFNSTTAQDSLHRQQEEQFLEHKAAMRPFLAVNMTVRMTTVQGDTFDTRLTSIEWNHAIQHVVVHYEHPTATGFIAVQPIVVRIEPLSLLWKALMMRHVINTTDTQQFVDWLPGSYVPSLITPQLMHENNLPSDSFIMTDVPFSFHKRASAAYQALVVRNVHAAAQEHEQPIDVMQCANVSLFTFIAEPKGVNRTPHAYASAHEPMQEATPAHTQSPLAGLYSDHQQQQQHHHTPGGLSQSSSISLGQLPQLPLPQSSLFSLGPSAFASPLSTPAREIKIRNRPSPPHQQDPYSNEAAAAATLSVFIAPSSQQLQESIGGECAFTNGDNNDEEEELMQRAQEANAAMQEAQRTLSPLTLQPSASPAAAAAALEHTSAIPDKSTHVQSEQQAQPTDQPASQPTDMSSFLQAAERDLEQEEEEEDFTAAQRSPSAQASHDLKNLRRTSPYDKEEEKRLEKAEWRAVTGLSLPDAEEEQPATPAAQDYTEAPALYELGSHIKGWPRESEEDAFTFITTQLQLLKDNSSTIAFVGEWDWDTDDEPATTQSIPLAVFAVMCQKLPVDRLLRLLKACGVDLDKATSTNVHIKMPSGASITLVKKSTALHLAVRMQNLTALAALLGPEGLMQKPVITPDARGKTAFDYILGPHSEQMKALFAEREKSPAAASLAASTDLPEVFHTIRDSIRSFKADDNATLNWIKHQLAAHPALKNITTEHKADLVGMSIFNLNKGASAVLIKMLSEAFMLQFSQTSCTVSYNDNTVTVPRGSTHYHLAVHANNAHALAALLTYTKPTLAAILVQDSNGMTAENVLEKMGANLLDLRWVFFNSWREKHKLPEYESVQESAAAAAAADPKTPERHSRLPTFSAAAVGSPHAECGLAALIAEESGKTYIVCPKCELILTGTVAEQKMNLLSQRYLKTRSAPFWAYDVVSNLNTFGTAIFKAKRQFGTKQKTYIQDEANKVLNEFPADIDELKPYVVRVCKTFP